MHLSRSGLIAELLDWLKTALAERYRVERELGHGGMATVYLAEDRKHHRQVAVKVLRAELASALGTERYLREIETVARLNHPHILPLHDSGESDGFLYYGPTTAMLPARFAASYPVVEPLSYRSTAPGRRTL